MRPDGQFLAAVHARGCSQDEVEGILGVKRQATDLRTCDIHWSRDGTRFAAIAVEA